MGGASLLIMLVVSVGHYRGVGRHVNRLLARMQSIGRGARHVESDQKGPNELRRLGEGLQTMVGDIDRAEQTAAYHQERQAAMNRRLQHQDKMAMIGRVAGGVAHELGAPLSVIAGRARILARSTEGEREQRSLRDIHYQIERMTRIIRQLLDCFRHVPNEPYLMRMAPVVGRVVDDLDALARERDIDLSLVTTGESLKVRGDATRLELAVSNLVRNALQAARSRVVVALAADSEALTLRVDDDGPGIPPEVGDDVFEPFYTTKAAGEGTGLGLAVVHSVMTECDGRITMGPNPWQGCRFEVRLPLVTAAAIQQNTGGLHG